MSYYYWKGPLNFPEDAGELTSIPVSYNKDTDRIDVLSAASVEEPEHVISGFDSEWLLCNNLQGKRNPVKLDSIVFIEEDSCYSIPDTKELIKVKRFDNNTKVHNITGSYRRTTY